MRIVVDHKPVASAIGPFLFALGLVVAVVGFGILPMDPVAAQRPTDTPRPTATPRPSGTPTKTFTPTPTDTSTPGTPTPTRTPTKTKTPRPPTDTPEPTDTPTLTPSPTNTPGLTPVTPIIEATATPIYLYGTRLPISGVESVWTPVIIIAPQPSEPTTPPTVIVMPTHEPTSTFTPSPTPSDRLGPAAPTGLVATAGSGIVILEWNPNKEEDLDGYRVYRSSAQGSGYSKVVSVSKKVTRYIDNTVKNGVTYYYVVSAFDVNGNESPFSNEVSITPSALKGMPSSGASLGEALVSSSWVWAGVLTATLLALLGLRRLVMGKSHS